MMQLFDHVDTRGESKRNFTALLMLTTSYESGYEQDDIVQVADLICRCLRWVPSDRIMAA